MSLRPDQHLAARWLLAITAVVVLAACQPGENTLRVDDPWIREAPYGATALAGYMTVVWNGREPVRLVAVRSAHFGRAEMHATRTDGDRMRMAHLDEVPILPNGTTRFEPGGLHLMFISPDGAVNAGDRIPVELEFSDEREIQVEFEVRDTRPRN